MGRERGLLIVEIVEVRYDKGEGMGGGGDGGCSNFHKNVAFSD